jgi:sugar O-acyltransferase (sialic acid O-acetyltransferase NeuD family)
MPNLWNAKSWHPSNSNSKVIIFGIKDLAQLAHLYFREDTTHQVVAFSVHQKYCPKDMIFDGKPIIPFEEVEKVYSPYSHEFFAPLSGSRMNKDRESIYQQIKEKGYRLTSYISSKATVINHKIGENCFILEDNTIQPFVEIGNNVVMWSGNHIGHHSIIKDHAFFTSHVVLSGHCNVGPYSWFGVNSTIRDGLTIAEGSLIAMSACLTKDTEPYGVYMGTPAKKIEGKTSLEANP